MTADTAKAAGEIRLNADFLLPLRQGKQGWRLEPGETVYTCFSSDFLLEEADRWRPDAWRMMRIRQDLHFVFFTKRIELSGRTCSRPTGGRATTM